MDLSKMAAQLRKGGATDEELIEFGYFLRFEEERERQQPIELQRQRSAAMVEREKNPAPAPDRETLAGASTRRVGAGT
jgi:hypothetical protein